MPQLILEYSANLTENNFADLFAKCHTVLSEQLPTELAYCKSRAIRHTEFYIGNGATTNAFVHVQIHILPGATRTPTKLQAIGEHILSLLAAHFAVSLQTFHLRITCEIRQLSEHFFTLSSQP